MQPSIKFEKIWKDEDITELRVTVCNGRSIFTNSVYLGNQELNELHKSLDVFKTHYYGGLKDIEFGSFGREYANGAFHARLHFPKPGISILLLISNQNILNLKVKKLPVKQKCIYAQSLVYLITFS